MPPHGGCGDAPGARGGGGRRQRAGGRPLLRPGGHRRRGHPVGASAGGGRARGAREGVGRPRGGAVRGRRLVRPHQRSRRGGAGPAGDRARPLGLRGGGGRGRPWRAARRGRETTRCVVVAPRRRRIRAHGDRHVPRRGRRQRARCWSSGRSPATSGSSWPRRRPGRASRPASTRPPAIGRPATRRTGSTVPGSRPSRRSRGAMARRGSRWPVTARGRSPATARVGPRPSWRSTRPPHGFAQRWARCGGTSPSATASPETPRR